MSSRAKKPPTKTEIKKALSVLRKAFGNPEEARVRAIAWKAHDILLGAGFYPHGWTREDGLFVDHTSNADCHKPFECMGLSGRDMLSLDDLEEAFKEPR